MAERSWRPEPPELERALADLGGQLDYPPTPDLARSVGSRLRAEPPRPRQGWRWLLARRPVLAALSVLLLIGGVLALSPAARTALADRLGLRGIAISYVPWLVPSSEPIGRELRLGDRVTLAEARARVAYQVLTPALTWLGSPDEVYVGTPPPDGQVALLYRARAGLPPAAETGLGLLLAQFRGAVEREYFFKALGPGARLVETTVNGSPAYWIEGQPHLFIYRDPDGRIREENIRLAGNTLIWQQGDLTLRLESALPMDEALRIAASVR